MIKIKKKKFINYYQKWFYKNLEFKDCFRIVSYIQSPKIKNKFLFKEKEFYTIKINLEDSIEKIYKNFSKETQYEIRRAMKENFEIKYNYNLVEFIKFYNNFAKLRGLKLLKKDDFNFIPENNYIITAIFFNKTPLVMHFYLIDNKRARLLYSAVTTEKTIKKSLIGIANRSLHYNDILYFIKLNYKVYDLGGYSMNTSNQKLLGINKFKKSFGGKIEKEYNYYSPLYILLNKIRNVCNYQKSRY